MEYKTGDRVLCKKYCVYFSTNSGTLEFIEGSYYIVEQFDGDSVYIRYNDRIGLWFNIFSDCYSNDFKNYFYTEKEVRRLKLDKLGRSSLIV